MTGYQVAYCEPCAREVLLAMQLQGDDLVRCCMHCDAVPTGAVRDADPDLLDELGYDVPGQRPKDGARGCRGGACGVRQPVALVE